VIIGSPLLESRPEARIAGGVTSLALSTFEKSLVSQMQRLTERDKRLIAPGVTLGGARPKGLLELDGEPWLVKFSDGDPVDSPLVEHAAMTLAARAAIQVAATRPVRLVDGHAIAIKRFDRTAGGSRRLHALSAQVALRAAGEELGYPELAQLLRRKGPATTAAAQMRELFRRMVFNILIDNTDDHEKNHVLLGDDAGAYHLSPAFDVLPSGQALGLQQLKVGARGFESTLENALSEARLFGLTPKEASRELRRVASVVDERPHFQACGVTRADLELLTEQLDRPFLAEQRRAAR
jgi:serine/threonine-protein kinase HipA